MPRDEQVRELIRSMPFNERLCVLVCSVIQNKRDAIDSAFYLVNSVSVMASMGLSTRGKLKLVDKLREASDEIESQALLEIVH